MSMKRFLVLLVTALLAAPIVQGCGVFATGRPGDPTTDQSNPCRDGGTLCRDTWGQCCSPRHPTCATDGDGRPRCKGPAYQQTEGYWGSAEEELVEREPVLR